MRRIDHLIVPVEVPPTSDLTIAQPITFASMREAQKFARGTADVRLLAARFADESISLPEGFSSVPPLTRSVADMRAFRTRRKLAYLKDILDRLHDESNAEFVIYTNVDIALQPHFYEAVSAYIDAGYDAFTINRRTIPEHYHSADQLPQMYAEKGMPHAGYDCFVFQRSLYPSFVVGDVFLGTGHVDLPLICSMIAYAGNFTELRDEHLTFHIGDSKTWWSWKNRDYIRACDHAAATSLRKIAARKGWTKKVRPHVDWMLRAAVLKNRRIVDEWLRLRNQEREQTLS